MSALYVEVEIRRAELGRDPMAARRCYVIAEVRQSWGVVLANALHDLRALLAEEFPEALDGRKVKNAVDQFERAVL